MESLGQVLEHQVHEVEMSLQKVLLPSDLVLDMGSTWFQMVPAGLGFFFDMHLPVLGIGSSP